MCLNAPLYLLSFCKNIHPCQPGGARHYHNNCEIRCSHRLSPPPPWCHGQEMTSTDNAISHLQYAARHHLWRFLFEEKYQDESVIICNNSSVYTFMLWLRQRPISPVIKSLAILYLEPLIPGTSGDHLALMSAAISSHKTLMQTLRVNISTLWTTKQFQVSSPSQLCLVPESK